MIELRMSVISVCLLYCYVEDEIDNIPSEHDLSNYVTIIHTIMFF